MSENDTLGLFQEIRGFQNSYKANKVNSSFVIGDTIHLQQRH